MVFLRGLLVVDDPVLVVDDVLVHVCLADLEVHVQEPLVRDGVELHVVAHLPVIHGAADLDLLVLGASIVQHEHLWLLLLVADFVECAHDGREL